MPLPDLRTAIDSTWPDVERTRDQSWIKLAVIFMLGAALTAITLSYGGEAGIPILATAFAIHMSAVHSIEKSEPERAYWQIK